MREAKVANKLSYYSRGQSAVVPVVTPDRPDHEDNDENVPPGTAARSPSPPPEPQRRNLTRAGSNAEAGPGPSSSGGASGARACHASCACRVHQRKVEVSCAPVTPEAGGDAAASASQPSDDETGPSSRVRQRNRTQRSAGAHAASSDAEPAETPAETPATGEPTSTQKSGLGRMLAQIAPGQQFLGCRAGNLGDVVRSTQPATRKTSDSAAQTRREQAAAAPVQCCCPEHQGLCSGDAAVLGAAASSAAVGTRGASSASNTGGNEADAGADATPHGENAATAGAAGPSGNNPGPSPALLQAAAEGAARLSAHGDQLSAAFIAISQDGEYHHVQWSKLEQCLAALELQSNQLALLRKEITILRNVYAHENAAVPDELQQTRRQVAEMEQAEQRSGTWIPCRSVLSPPSFGAVCSLFSVAFLYVVRLLRVCNAYTLQTPSMVCSVIGECVAWHCFLIDESLRSVCGDMCRCENKKCKHRGGHWAKVESGDIGIHHHGGKSIVVWVCACGTRTQYNFDVPYVPVNGSGEQEAEQEKHKSAQLPYLITHARLRIGIPAAKVQELMCSITGHWPVDPNAEAKRIEEVSAVTCRLGLHGFFSQVCHNAASTIGHLSCRTWQCRNCIVKTITCTPFHVGADGRQAPHSARGHPV